MLDIALTPVYSRCMVGADQVFAVNRFGPIRDLADPRVAHHIIHCGADATRLILPAV
jgi:hypothetical protein